MSFPAFLPWRGGGVGCVLQCWADLQSWGCRVLACSLLSPRVGLLTTIPVSAVLCEEQNEQGFPENEEQCRLILFYFLFFAVGSIHNELSPTASFLMLSQQ